MSYKLKDLKSDMHFNFGTELKALLKYLATSWDISAQPKGYAKYKKNYKDFQDMEEQDEKALLKSFDGHDSTGTLSGSFPLRVSMPQVAYDDVDQGCKPLETLLGAVLGHGIHIGERLAALDSRSDANSRLNYYDGAMLWFILKDDSSDQQIGMLALMEANEYKNELGTDCREIKAKYDEKRRVYLTGKLEALRKYLQGVEGPIIFLNPDKSNFASMTNDNKMFHETLLGVYSLMGHEEKKFKKFMSSLGFNAASKSYNFTVSLRKKRVKKEAL
jgi:hypothetical protein